MSLTPPPLRSGSVPATVSATAGMGGAQPLPPPPPAGNVWRAVGRHVRRSGLVFSFFPWLGVWPAQPAHAFAWPDAAERVESDLRATDTTTRRAAARGLTSLGPTRGTALTLFALDDPDDEVRLEAARAAIRAPPRK